MHWITIARWSPYAVGLGIGLLSCLTFFLSNRPLGCSTAFTRTSGMIERLFRGPKVNQKPYYRKFTPEVDWEWMLVLGVVIGAFLSAAVSGDFELKWTPASWVEAFGSGVAVRVVVAFLGGILLGLGARWAGGCTSGHGISGTLQLVLGSWITAACFFIGGIATAMIVFKLVAG